MATRHAMDSPRAKYSIVHESWHRLMISDLRGPLD
jgi:hypothetical protein